MKTVIITGANQGLGFETAKKIAAKSNDFNVILACRNIERAEKAKDQIINETKNPNISVMILDTSSLKSVREFVENYRQNKKEPIHALICNAGISSKSNTAKQVSKDGFDIIFATNHLGHFLLCNLMLPFMEKRGKIISIASDMHDPPVKEGQKFEWLGVEPIAHPNDEMAMDRSRYSYSKLCNVYFVYEFAKILKEKNSEVTVNAFNPGLMKTNFTDIEPKIFEFIRINAPHRYGDLEKSSSSLAELIYSDLIQSSGNYYDRSTSTVKTSELSYNEKNAKELWDKSLEYTGLNV
ncbi:hypothetical protein PIROE2DRAFT_60210 [Piromyces sp. E2]|nr:hypothetical protein PIROE2DRAFT_60210 [Piromyces sp. E2]|eukprot:OUM65164.1 hypothetical protein PIROE2DRAFT_60210 [Piromyces sp. E2]